MIRSDKEETLDALIRNVKDQQRESQVATTSVFVPYSHLQKSPFLLVRLPCQFLEVL